MQTLFKHADIICSHRFGFYVRKCVIISYSHILLQLEDVIITLLKSSRAVNLQSSFLEKSHLANTCIMEVQDYFQVYFLMKEQHIQNKNIILNFQIIQYLSIKYTIKCYNGRHYCKSLSRGRNSLNIQLTTYCMYTNKMNNFTWLFAI